MRISDWSSDVFSSDLWLEEQDRITGGRLVKVIRLVKYIRDFKNNFSIKSVIATILLGGRVNDAALWADPDHYNDLPPALKNRSAERREGKECVSTCRYRRSSYHSKKKNTKKLI